MIDWSKPICAADGSDRPVRFVTRVNDGSKYQNLVIFIVADGLEKAVWVNDNGQPAAIRWPDVMNVPEPKKRGEFFVNVYSDSVAAHLSRMQADLVAMSNRLACVRVDWTEGDGL